MSGIVFKRGFTGDNDRLCVSIEDHAPSHTRDLLDPYDTFCIITYHQHYWRCDDTWYPESISGFERMMMDIKVDLDLDSAQMTELHQALVDLMTVGERVI